METIKIGRMQCVATKEKKAEYRDYQSATRAAAVVVVLGAAAAVVVVLAMVTVVVRVAAVVAVTDVVGAVASVVVAVVDDVVAAFFAQQIEVLFNKKITLTTTLYASQSTMKKSIMPRPTRFESPGLSLYPHCPEQTFCKDQRFL